MPPCHAPDAPVTELTDYAQASEGERYWVVVEHHDRYDEWLPAEHIDMPMHHASRLDWRNRADHPELADATDARLRFTFELVSEDIQKVPGRHEWRATYGARIVGVCAPSPP